MAQSVNHLPPSHQNLYLKFYMWTCEIAEWVKVLADKPGTLSSNLGTPMVERKNCLQISSGLHMDTAACIKHQVNREITILFKVPGVVALVILALERRDRNRWNLMLSLSS